MSWEHWLINNGEHRPLTPLTPHDKLIEIVISSYELDRKSRKQELCDMRQQLIIWWWKSNKKLFNKYKTKFSVGVVLKMDHASVIHYIETRKPSHRYEENTACIKDMLES